MYIHPPASRAKYRGNLPSSTYTRMFKAYPMATSQPSHRASGSLRTCLDRRAQDREASNLARKKAERTAFCSTGQKWFKWHGLTKGLGRINTSHPTEGVVGSAAARFGLELGLIVTDLGLAAFRLAGWHKANLSLADGAACSCSPLLGLHVLGARTE